MANPDPDDYSQTFGIQGAVEALKTHKNLILRMTAAATIIGTLGVGWYYYFQPARWSAFLDFNPVFEGADRGRYPNGLAFATSDITDSTILDAVYDKNQLKDLCPRGEFRSSFVVQQTSNAVQVLDLEYQARLSDSRISPIERQRLQEEYGAKRSALAGQYRLTFIRPPSCPALPRTVIFKTMTDVLETWATDADARRGVLKARADAFTPAIFDFGEVADPSLLVRSEQIRTGIMRVLGNIERVQALPGAELIRVPGSGLGSFAEVHARLEDLVQAYLDPLVVAAAGVGGGRDSTLWVQEALHAATLQRDAAQARADAVLQAINVFSGSAAPAAANASAPSQRPANETQSVAQLDRGFIQEIVSMSSGNSAYRQQLTGQLVEASIDAIRFKKSVQHLQMLQESMGRRGDTGMSVAEVARRLGVITDQAKAATATFGKLYDEFNRVAFRAATSMYRVDRAAQSESLQAFSLRRAAIIVLAVLLLTPLLVAAVCVIVARLKSAVDASRPA